MKTEYICFFLNHFYYSCLKGNSEFKLSDIPVILFMFESSTEGRCQKQ